MQTIPTWGICGYTAGAIPAGTDITLSGENIVGISSDTGSLNSCFDTMCRFQRFDSSIHTTQAPAILGFDSVGLVVPDKPPTMCADHAGPGLNCFPLSRIQSSGDRHAPLHPGTLEDKGLLAPALNHRIMLDSSALYPPREVAHGSLETQYGCLGEPRDYPQLSLEPTKRRATVPISRSITSSKRPIKERTGLYSCGVCGDKFAQLQGARRHHREKHEPGQCPHCHAFRWGRLYLFKRHLKREHPEIDPEEATLDATRKNQRNRVETSSFPVESKSSPTSPPLDSHTEIPDTNSEGAMAEALRPSQRVGMSHGCGLPRRRRARDSGGITAYEAFQETEMPN